MDAKYKRAREEMGVFLHDIVDRVNKDLVELGSTAKITNSALFRIEEGLRKKDDIKKALAMKYYRKIYAAWEYQQKIKEVDKKYGG